MTLEKVACKEKPMADSLVQLEFAKVVKLVVAKTQTIYGRSLAEALHPLFERPGIEEALREAKEAVQLLQEDGPLALGSGDDLLPHLDCLRTQGLRLEAEVLRDVQAALEAALECRQKLLKSEVCPSSARGLKFLIRLLSSWPICERASKVNVIESSVNWIGCCRMTGCRVFFRSR
jgi:dsDNA-specific endonuclease/ATPase MutS2